MFSHCTIILIGEALTAQNESFYAVIVFIGTRRGIRATVWRNLRSGNNHRNPNFHMLTFRTFINGFVALDVFISDVKLASFSPWMICFNLSLL